MFGWRVAAAIAASAVILAALLILFIVRRFYYRPKPGRRVAGATAAVSPPPAPLSRKAERWSSQEFPKPEMKTRQNYSGAQRGSATKPLFNWNDHPSLISDAAENGWSRFAFTNYASSSSTRSTLLSCIEDLHHHHSNQRDTQVEVNWELGEGSMDFMQKIRLNTGLKKASSSSSSMAVRSVIRTALPLPGPPLGNSSSFPQEAYFEITILSVPSSSSSGSLREDRKSIEGENLKAKLITDKDSESKRMIECKTPVAKCLEEVKHGSRGGGGGLMMMMSVGLTSSTVVPLKVPGTYPASIGFNSDGSLYLDGIKLVLESEEGSYEEQKVIGCGFNPKQKRVFFTVNSELVHMVNCMSQDFGGPMYPVIAANADVTLLVNLGQAAFAYLPANASRTPNPCFDPATTAATGTTGGYEDSGELFSIGRIDSGWLNANSEVYSWYVNSTAKSRSKGAECGKEDDESEADLFEIVLDVNGKSPKV